MKILCPVSILGLPNSNSNLAFVRRKLAWRSIRGVNTLEGKRGNEQVISKQALHPVQKSGVKTQT